MPSSLEQNKNVNSLSSDSFSDYDSDHDSKLSVPLLWEQNDIDDDSSTDNSHSLCSIKDDSSADSSN